MKYITPESLGCKYFKNKHSVKYAYLTGGMYGGVSSKELVCKMANSGFLSFLGAGGLKLEEIEDNIKYIKEHALGKPFGINFLHNHIVSAKDESIINLLLKYDVNMIEAGAFPKATSSLVRYRLKGISINNSGKLVMKNKIFLKTSRLSVIDEFLSPISEMTIEALLANKQITLEEASYADRINLVDDIIIEADSAGHTDNRSGLAMFPTMVNKIRKFNKSNPNKEKISIGLSGGIGTPEAIAAAFAMGADFVSTGSINQCTVEAGTSELVKKILSEMNVEDTDVCPTGDMLESGAKIQVLKKGTLFSVRSKKIYGYYMKYDSFDDMDDELIKDIEKELFNNDSLDKVFNDAKTYFSPLIWEEACTNSRKKMALILKMYYYKSIIYARQGDKKHKINFQVHVGPALGAFNNYVSGSSLEDYKNRHVDQIALKLLADTCELINDWFINTYK